MPNKMQIREQFPWIVFKKRQELNFFLFLYLLRLHFLFDAVLNIKLVATLKFLFVKVRKLFT